MPVVSRSRTVPASPERLWTVVADPQQLAKWWPNVERVEDASRDAWTAVLTSPKGGRALRADYTLVDSDHPHRLRWRHEVEESPFERIFSSAVTEVELEPLEGETLVRLTGHLGLRGFSRFGGFQVTRATRRQFDGALQGLVRLAEDWRAAP
ncbi:MAG: SRPBCC family protein [Thermoleophilaceae bacterium]